VGFKYIAAEMLKGEVLDRGRGNRGAWAWAGAPAERDALLVALPLGEALVEGRPALGEPARTWLRAAHGGRSAYDRPRNLRLKDMASRDAERQLARRRRRLCWSAPCWRRSNQPTASKLAAGPEPLADAALLGHSNALLRLYCEAPSQERVAAVRPGRSSSPRR